MYAAIYCVVAVDMPESCQQNIGKIDIEFDPTDASQVKASDKAYPL